MDTSHEVTRAKTLPLEYASKIACTVTLFYIIVTTTILFLFQLKAVIVDDNLQALQEAKVLFDVDLPEFR